MTPLRVVLDTNVLVSGIAYPQSNPGRIVSLWRRGKLRLTLSQYILDEVGRVLPRLSRITMTELEVRELVETFHLLAEIVEPSSEVEPGLRDVADQKVLGTLRAGNGSYLITGDKDLLALADRYPILTPAEFLLRHGE